MDRRGLMLGAGAALGAWALPGQSQALDGAHRRFELFRGREKVGYHTIAARETGGGLQVDINILIEVRRLGIRFYVYDHKNTEFWRNGRLMRLATQTNNDGSQEFATVERQGDTLKVEGTAFNGEVAGDSAPTSYWNYQNFQTKTWISTQTGQPLNLAFTKRREGPLERWDVGGDMRTSVTLFYDGQQEWRGCRFDAQGTPIVYRQTKPGPAFSGLI